MGFTEREIGHMTLSKFSRLYQAYKNNFDNEMIMMNNKLKYSEFNKEITLNDIIPF